MRLAFHVLLVWCFFFSRVAIAELTEFNSRLWQAESGLPNNVVQAIAQTSDGYLWIGTREGLARFDGEQFVVKNLATGSIEPSVLTLLGDKDGRLWIGTDDSGVFLLTNGVLHQPEIPDGNVNLAVYAIKESGDGRVWFGTSRGVFSWSSNRVDRVANSISVHQKLCTDTKGHVWALENDLVQLDSPPGQTNSIHSSKMPTSARSLYCDNDGVFWLGSDSPPTSTLIRVQDGKVAVFPRADGPAGFVSMIYRDTAGELWIGSYAGLSRFVNDEFVSFQGPNEPSYRVYTIFEDLERDLWIGSEEGLTRLTPKRFRTLSKKNGLSLNNVVSVCPSQDGGVWIGTWGGGINHYLDGKITRFNTTSGLKSDFIMALAAGRDGSLWAGLDYSAPIHRIKDGTVSTLPQPEGTPLHDITATVALCESPDGSLWIGDRMFLLRWDGHRSTKYTIGDGLPSDSIHAICNGANGSVWIGTEGGLSQWREGKMSNLAEADPRHLNVAILSLYEDDQKTLWIGTRHHGLLRRSYDGEMKRFTTAEGLFCDTIYAVMEDNHTNFWLNSSRGIFRVGKRQLEESSRNNSPITSISYGRADGILANSQYRDVIQPAACKDAKGRLWFRTTQGVVFVDPDVIGVNEEPPLVLIQRIVADDNSLHLVRNASNNLDLIQVPPGRGDLEIQFAALSYRAPDKNHYRYRLIGSDRDWVEAGNSRVIKYNHLAPGHYRFEVKASNNEGIWNEAGQAVEMDLSPHIWETWWFFVISSLLAATVVAGTARYVTHRRMQKKLAKLELQHAVEEERKRIARDVHDELGSKLTWISFQGGIAKCRPDDPAETMKQIDRMSASARDAVSSLHEIIWAADPENDSLDGLVGHISHFTDQFFGITAIHCEVVAPEQIPALHLSAMVRHNLFLALKEALNNAAKHANATRVLIQIFARASELEVLISDNGTGFCLDVAGEATDRSPKRKGYGLVNMRKRLESIEGRCEINSEAGQGTSIRLVIPLQQTIG